jgi:predicted CopG family antitoxin
MYTYLEQKLASKTIMISEEAYEILKMRKRKNESFTDVIIRLGSERGSIAKLLDMAKSEDFEPITPETARQLNEASKEFRKNFKLRDTHLS